MRCANFIYVRRNEVERLWGRLKDWRAVATRCEKTVTFFKGVLCLAAWKHRHANIACIRMQ